MRSTSIEKAPRLRPLKGVEMAILGSGENMTLIRILIQPGAVFPDHSHPNEQIGTCLEGRGVLTSGGESLEVAPGVSWTIPPNETHSFVGKGDRPVVIYEGWSPPREDYLSMAEGSQ
ncbi:MAG: cupin domain-containing protein [Candidatus Bathyarchaeia archaeon]